MSSDQAAARVCPAFASSQSRRPSALYAILLGPRRTQGGPTGTSARLHRTNVGREMPRRWATSDSVKYLCVCSIAMVGEGVHDAREAVSLSRACRIFGLANDGPHYSGVWWSVAPDAQVGA
jgi:hypothetical protein